ncbi:MAG: CDP-alcohol phosphatidyltransferase family protein, partial [bacterium]
MVSLESLRGWAYRVLTPVTDLLVANRVHPNLLTTLGFLVTVSSGIAFHRHEVRVAGFLILLGGLFDILDGRVARLSDLGSKFGAFYDSTLDRIS